MTKIFTEENYAEMIQKLFHRFPSFQKAGAGAYKPGIANMEFAYQLMGHPHRQYRIIHLAGTNGKGSVSNMLASVLAACGMKVGLYTSPHILDFRERMRVVSATGYELIPELDVWNFVQQWQDTFDHLDMSFFEITTTMALDWFARKEVDLVVLETGLGGRLDSTNIVSPVMSVITNIGLDHCDMLGGTLPEIAFEKAGIIKPKSPVVIGESHPEIDAVFERKVLYTNLPEAEFMGNRAAIMSLLTFADKAEPSMWQEHEGLLARMDLRGSYQQKNLRTVLASLDVLSKTEAALAAAIAQDRMKVLDALAHTASRTGFAGRWQKLSDEPYVICDIGHNEHGLKYNFAQLAQMKREGECSHIIIVYGSVADKDVDAALELMPEDIVCIFTQAQGKRAMPAEQVKEKYLNFCAGAARPEGEVHVAGTVLEAVRKAMQAAAGIKAADPQARPLIYIGGSTYVVAEAAACIR
jgi:dihydrofolate synthase/folylpolyglutamate synthase